MELGWNLDLLLDCALELNAGLSNMEPFSTLSMVLSPRQLFVETLPRPPALGMLGQWRSNKNTSKDPLLDICSGPGTVQSISRVQQLLLLSYFADGKTEASNTGLSGQSSLSQVLGLAASSTERGPGHWPRVCTQLECDCAAIMLFFLRAGTRPSVSSVTSPSLVR